MDTSLRLPYELLEAISQLAEPRDLSVLARTSIALQGISESILYRRVECKEARRTCQILKAITRTNSARHNYVRKFTVQLPEWIEDHAGSLFAPFYQLLSRALSLMSEIQQLSILDIPQSAAWVLRGCTSQPVVFASTILPCDSLVTWLQKQRRMGTLVLPYHHPASFNTAALAELTLDALPSLHTICARGGILHHLVPGRPVKSVSLDFTVDYSYDGVEYMEVLKSLSLSCGPVENLALHVRAAPRESCILPDFPKFERAGEVKLESVRNLTVYTSRIARLIRSELGNAQQSFPNLVSIQLEARVYPWLADWYLHNIATMWRIETGLRRVTFRDCGHYWDKFFAFEWNGDSMEALKGAHRPDGASHWSTFEEEVNLVGQAERSSLDIFGSIIRRL
jgi:hypothetical protein